MCQVNGNQAVNNLPFMGNQGPMGGNNRPLMGGNFGPMGGIAGLQNSQLVMNLVNVLVQLIQGLQQAQPNQGGQPNQFGPLLGGANQGGNAMAQPMPGFQFGTGNFGQQQPVFNFGAGNFGQQPIFQFGNQQPALNNQNVNNPFVNQQPNGQNLFAKPGQNVAPGPNGLPGQHGPVGNNPVHNHHNQGGVNQNVNVGVNNGVIIQIVNGNDFNARPVNPIHQKPGNHFPVNHQPLQPVAIKNDAAKIWGDPHFVGAEGGKYDVQGEAGKTYNILSDKGFQVNSTFAKYGNGGATVMGQIGITMGHNQIQIEKNGDLSINGEALKEGTYLDGAIEKKGKNVIVKDGEYNLTVKSAGTYLNIDFASKNVAADGVMPHGLWGQTADGDGEARNGDKGAGAQGGGAIERVDGQISAKGDKETVKSYEVNGLFDTNFQNFNKFHTQFDVVAQPVGAQGAAQDAVAQ